MLFTFSESKSAREKKVYSEEKKLITHTASFAAILLIIYGLRADDIRPYDAPHVLVAGG
jgi:hypothetical protein